jgi:hypothetical protein
MAANDRLKAAHDIYGAYVSGDRRVVEELLSDAFILYSPADVGIGRASYFPRLTAQRSGSRATPRSTRSP